MNDYKELIDGLEMLKFFNQRAGRELWANKPESVQNTDIANAEQILANAADAIEQLVRERDAAVKDLSHVLHNLGYDAILYSESVCGYCKHRHEKDGECQQHDCYSAAENWEWRGVQNG